MKLTEEVKQKILDEYNTWSECQYGSRTFEERQQLGQFFTPPELTIQMVEKFDNLEGTILDPCAGCGGLLAACIMAGVNPENIYANEYDEEIVKICKERLTKLGVPDWHIHQGDALDDRCYEFSQDYIYPFPEPEAVTLW